MSSQSSKFNRAQSERKARQHIFWCLFWSVRRLRRREKMRVSGFGAFCGIFDPDEGRRTAQVDASRIEQHVAHALELELGSILGFALP